METQIKHLSEQPPYFYNPEHRLVSVGVVGEIHAAIVFDESAKASYEDLEIKIPENQEERLSDFTLFYQEINFAKISAVFAGFNTFLGSHVARGGGSLTDLLTEERTIVEIMGPDDTDAAHPLRQVLRTLHVFEKNSDTGVLSEDEKGLLQLVALFHDLGELIHGDVKDGEKYSPAEQQENQTARNIAKSIFSNQEIMLEDVIDEEIIDLIFDIERGERSPENESHGEIDVEKLYSIWRNQVERVEYIDSALHAWEYCEANQDLSDADKATLQSFVRECLANHFEHLLEYSKDNPEISTSVADFLEQRKGEISKILEQTASDDQTRSTGIMKTGAV